MLAALNHVRIPAALSLLLLVVYLPLILRVDPDRYMDTTGLSLDLYLGRWLLISAALFLISGVVYAIRLRRGAIEGAIGGGGGEAPSAAPDPGDRQTVGGLWRAGSRFVLALTGLATVWVIATVIVGLISNGF
jgi:hypothetical protein